MSYLFDYHRTCGSVDMWFADKQPNRDSMTPIERLVTTVLAGNDYHCLPQVRLATAQSHITAVLDEDASMANSVAKLVEVV